MTEKNEVLVTESWLVMIFSTDVLFDSFWRHNEQISIVESMIQVQRTMLELLNQLDGFEPQQNIKGEKNAQVWFLTKI